MTIRSKILLIVIPLISSALIISATINSFSARSGMTRIAMSALGFKAQELNKYMESQWNLLVTNELHEDPEYVGVAKNAITSYADTIIRTDGEVIFAVETADYQIAMATSDIALSEEERDTLKDLFLSETAGWIELSAGGTPRVGNAFFFEPFGWYVVVSEETSRFYQAITEITVRSAIVLGISLLMTLVLILMFSNYLSGPITRVAATMKRVISDNDLSARVEVEFRDEIGELAHTFNIMLNELQKAYNQIKGYAFQAVLAQRNERKVRNIFQKYVPKDVIDTLFANPESMLTGENRVLAILFSDIRSFTTISEGYMPDELVNNLNKYFELMVDIIMDHGGVIDKYIGDAIMAFFGAPVKHKNDALNAVATALKMQNTLRKFNAELEAGGKPKFITGIGINYGVVTVGNIGSQKKMDYTVIGDMVNRGSRLEGLTKYYRQDIIFSESVFRKVQDTFPCRFVDTVQVKGKTLGEKIYTAYESAGENMQNALKIHHAAMNCFYERDFKKARQYFQAVLKLLPDDFLAAEFIQRCDTYIATPPPSDWNGTEVMKTK
ncbi:MAG: adenylate/guanylate cyclase domain-containing protein [Spirochaetales bacterium]|nr:adenylate/guanylate cyclase domain-containing protein [Spirochaetales bacterium]